MSAWSCAPRALHRARAVQVALMVHGAALALGEGACALSAGALLLACTWARGVAGMVPLWRAASHATNPLLGFAAFSVAAALSSPMGLRPSAPGPLVVLLAPALIGVAGHIAGPRALIHAARAFVMVLLIGGLGAGLLGVFDMSWPRPWALELHPSHRQGFVPGTNQMGAGGFYVHRLKMAHALLPAAAIGLGRGYCDALGRVRGLRRWRGWLVVALSLALLWPTGARGALGGTLVGLAAAGSAWRWPTRPIGRRASGVILVLLIGAGFGVGSRVHAPTAAPREGIATRAVLWRCALEQASLHPFGVGIGNVADAMGTCLAAQAPMTRSPRTAPHNSVLCAWLLGGGAGAVLLLSVWVRLVVYCARALRDSSQTLHARGAAATGLVFVLGYAVVGVVHDILFQHAVTTWTAYSLMGGLIWFVAPKATPR